jgi:branched-chain amino acid transport system permease protein
MFAGAVLAAIMGVAIAWISFRYALPPLSFALVTLALAMMGYLAIGATEFFGGNGGLAITGRGSPWTYQFRGDWPYYYVILVYCLLAVGLSGWIYHSKPGLYFRALRDNDRASRAIGINVLRYKMLAMGISAFLSALGGTFYAQYLLYVDPRTFAGLNIVIEIILFTVVGGTGTILGPVVGPLLAVPLGEWLRNSLGDAVPGLHLLLFGVLLVLVIRFMPAGIVGSLARIRPVKSKSEKGLLRRITH